MAVKLITPNEFLGIKDEPLVAAPIVQPVAQPVQPQPIKKENIFVENVSTGESVSVGLS